MYRTHLQVVALEQFAGLCEAFANSKVLAGPSLKLFRQARSVHDQNLAAAGALPLPSFPIEELRRLPILFRVAIIPDQQDSKRRPQRKGLL